MMKEFIKFIISPNTDLSYHKTISKKITTFIHITFLYFIIIIPLDYLINTYLEQDKYVSSVNVNIPSSLTWLYSLILAPIFEELQFRLGLRFKLSYIKLSIALIFFWMIFVHEINLWFTEITYIFYFKLGLFSIVLIFINRLTKKENVINKLRDIWQCNFGVVLYGFILIFTIFHMNRYYISNDFFIRSPLILSTIFILGIFTSYVRLKLGFLWSVVFHIINNFVKYLIAFLLFVNSYREQEIRIDHLKKEKVRLERINDSLINQNKRIEQTK